MKTKTRRLGTFQRPKKGSYRMTVISIVDDTQRTVSSGLKKTSMGFEIRGRIEIIQTTALLRSARKLRRVLET